MTCLVIAEHDNSQLKPATLHTVTAARACGGGVHLLVAGHEAHPVAAAAAAIAGLDKILLADGLSLREASAENLAAQVLAVAADYSHILFAATSCGKSAAPRVAAQLDTSQISDIIGVVSPDTFERPIYAGNVVATVQSSDATKVITVRATAFAPAANQGGAAPVECIEAVADTGLSTFVGREVSRSDRPDLTAVPIVVAGGRGLGSKENFADVLTPLAENLNAGLGASRAAVDAGFAPNDWQIGQTGKIVAPQLYIAVGISGAIQHLAGMKDSKIIVAINKDGEAPIFGIANYGLQADLHQAVPELVLALREAS
jgi:electron transfer flavoprotein alpha subunit